MTPPIADNVFVWLVDWSIVAITDNNKMPPRDPDDDDDDAEDEDDEGEPDEEPAVVREPDE
jgi:hypothetical protein